MRIKFEAMIRDGIYRRTVPEFTMAVDDDLTDDDIDEIVREEIINNMLEYEWRREDEDVE